MMKRIFYISVLILLMIAPQAGSSPIQGLLNNTEIMYIYQDESQIDWPLIYHLGAEQGCRVEVVRFSLGPVANCNVTQSGSYDIIHADYIIPDTSNSTIDSVMKDVTGLRAPDIVLMPNINEGNFLISVRSYFISNNEMPELFSSVKALYYRANNKEQAEVFANALYYITRAGDKIENLVDELLDKRFDPDNYDGYTMYRADEILNNNQNQKSFLSKATSYHITDAVNECVYNAELKRSLSKYALKYEEYIRVTFEKTDESRIEALIAALGQLINIKVDFRPSGGELFCDHFESFVADLIDRTERAIMYETGFEYAGQGHLLPTSEGHIIKIMSNYQNKGAFNYHIGNVRLRSESEQFDNSIDTISFALPAYRTIKREYSVVIPSEYYSNPSRDKLYLEGDLIFKKQYMTFRYPLAELGESPISLSFVPSFRLIRPFVGDRIDHLVEMTQLKLLVEKPLSYVTTATLEFTTPPGVHVGTYKEEIQLKDGDRSYEINLPIAIGKSAGNRKLKVIATLKDKEKTIGWDQANILGLECNVSEKAKIALISGNEGQLEDIFRMTGVGYQTISDRYLETGYIGLYDIILFDTDCFENYPSISKISDKIKRFIEFGGSVIMFGQNETWPTAAFPVSIRPSKMTLDSKNMKLSGSAKDILFSKTYKTSPTYLINAVKDSYRSYPAEVFPSDAIITAGSEQALLTRTKIGSGQLIYCGFPLADMFADLEPLAVKFFANLINSSSK